MTRTDGPDPVPDAPRLSYDFLFSATEHRTVEDAAVRDLPDDDTGAGPRVVGVLRLADGRVVPIDRTVIIGRRPHPDASTTGEHPRLVRVDAEGYLSRNHLRVSPNGASIVVTDLASTNGSTITRPGRAPEPLVANHPTPIGPGSVITLAERVAVALEAAP